MEGEVLPRSSRGYSGDVGLDSAKWSFLDVRACVSVACVRWGLQALVRGEERRGETQLLGLILVIQGLGEGEQV